MSCRACVVLHIVSPHKFARSVTRDEHAFAPIVRSDIANQQVKMHLAQQASRLRTRLFRHGRRVKFRRRAMGQSSSQGKTEKYTERQWWFKVDWDDAEEEDGIDPWVNLKDVKALRAAFVG